MNRGINQAACGRIRISLAYLLPGSRFDVVRDRIHGAWVGAESSHLLALAMPVFRIPLASIGMLVMVVLLPAIAGWSRVASAAGASACPDVSGRYSVRGTGSGTWTALTDVLAAMQAKEAGYLDGGIEFSGATDGTLSVWTKSGRLSHWSTRPAAVLHAGTDFECQSGRLVFIAPVKNTTRKTDEGKWYEGEATASLSRGANGELSIAVRFTGSERISLYRYDSADVSIPKPGTRTTLTNSFSWPVYSDAESLAPIQPVISKIERDTRQRLTPQVLGNATLIALKPSGDGALAILNVPRGDDVVAFEDRLRAADILYETQVEPSWWTNKYRMELLIRPLGAVATSPARVSVFRIEKELQRTLPMLAVLNGIVVSKNGYVVTLNIHDSTSIANIIQRVQLNSTLITTMDLVEEARPAGSQMRVARIQVCVH